MKKWVYANNDILVANELCRQKNIFKENNEHFITYENKKIKIVLKDVPDNNFSVVWRFKQLRADCSKNLSPEEISVIELSPGSESGIMRGHEVATLKFLRKMNDENNKPKKQSEKAALAQLNTQKKDEEELDTHPKSTTHLKPNVFKQYTELTNAIFKSIQPRPTPCLISSNTPERKFDPSLDNQNSVRPELYPDYDSVWIFPENPHKTVNEDLYLNFNFEHIKKVKTEGLFITQNAMYWIVTKGRYRTLKANGKLEFMKLNESIPVELISQEQIQQLVNLHSNYSKNKAELDVDPNKFQCVYTCPKKNLSLEDQPLTFNLLPYIYDRYNKPTQPVFNKSKINSQPLDKRVPDSYNTHSMRSSESKDLSGMQQNFSSHDECSTTTIQSSVNDDELDLREPLLSNLSDNEEFAVTDNANFLTNTPEEKYNPKSTNDNDANLFPKSSRFPFYFGFFNRDEIPYVPDPDELITGLDTGSQVPLLPDLLDSWVDEPKDSIKNPRDSDGFSFEEPPSKRSK